MFAKQTAMSASLVVWWFGASSALADDSAPAEPDTGEVHPPSETPAASPPGETAPQALPQSPPPIEHRTGRFSIGAGYSSEEGFIAQAQVAQDDLFYTGTQLSLTTRISALEQLFDVHVGHQHLFDTNWGISSDLYADTRALPGVTRAAVGWKTDISHPLGEHARAFVGYRIEDVTATDTLATAARGVAPDLPALGGGTLSALRGGLEWSNVDRLETRGAKLGATVEVGDHVLGSDYNLTKVHAFAQSHIPIGPLVLHLSGGLDSVLGDAPRSERIYLGLHDVRGYGPGDFGPINSLGQPIGGDLELTGRAELELPISRRYGISLIGFYDAAAITANGQGEAAGSYGFGILWRSPIGNLRFDWAFPADGGKPRFGFGF